MCEGCVAASELHLQLQLEPCIFYSPTASSSQHCKSFFMSPFWLMFLIVLLCICFGLCMQLVVHHVCTYSAQLLGHRIKLVFLHVILSLILYVCWRQSTACACLCWLGLQTQCTGACILRGALQAVSHSAFPSPEHIKKRPVVWLRSTQCCVPTCKNSHTIKKIFNYAWCFYLWEGILVFALNYQTDCVIQPQILWGCLCFAWAPKSMFACLDVCL